MKKQYIVPNVQVIGIRPMTMLAESPRQLTVDPTTYGSQSAAEGRQFSGGFDWDEE